MGSEVRLAATHSPLVGDRGRSVTFVVDTSEDMRGLLASAKRLLIGTLLRKAAFRDSPFNIVTFSGQVVSWSQHMLPCAPDTLYLALAWIHSINCSPGGDLWGALSTAFADPACEAVHLLCSGLPGRPEALLTALPRLAGGRPLNIFYLQSSAHRLAGGSMQQLARATGGRCYTIPLGFSGDLKEEGFSSAQHQHCWTPNASHLPNAQEGERLHQMHSSLRWRCPPASVLALRTAPSAVSRCTVGNPCVTSCEVIPEFFPGCRVLARRKIDGLYYRGIVMQQMQPCGGVWVVEFEPLEGATWGGLSCHRELVSSQDMVSSAGGAPWCDLVPGDAVLSPWEPGVRRYGPGRVMAVCARRRDGCGGGATSLRVQMWNSCLPLVPAHLAEPVPHAHYDRIVEELRITAPPSGRFCHWLWVPHCCSGLRTPPQPGPASCASSWKNTVGLQEAELEDQEVMKSDSDVASDSSSSSSLSGQETSRRPPPAVKLRGGQQRPPWRYWRRTGSEPQHKQPASENARRTAPPLPTRFHLPVPPLSTSPNHSSLFQPLPGVAGRRATSGDVFRPHPPPRPQTSGGNNSAVYKSRPGQNI